MISIIVPVYNTEEYLVECIQSILEQSYSDFELLLINDGSTDQSGKICDDFSKKDTRVKVYHQKNQGVSNARNNGINLAKGEWICFIDSDDYVESGYLSSFINQGHLQKNCLNQQGWKIRRKNDVIEPGFNYPDEFIEKNEFAAKISYCKIINNNSPYSKLFNKDLLDELNLRFDTNLKIREDALFVYQYRNAVSCARLLPDSYYQYRRIDNRISLSQQIHQYPQFLYIKKNLIPIVREFLKIFDLEQNEYARNAYNSNKSSTIISGLKSIYAHKVNYKIRKEVLKELLGDKKYYNDEYFNLNGLLKRIYSVYSVLPLRIFDSILFICMKPYYRFIYFQKNFN